MTRKGLIFLVFTICAITLVKADVNSEWRKPDDWSRHRREVEHQEKLKAKENVENGLMIPQETCKKDEKTVDIAKMSYMRVMRKVFNKQRFKKEKSGLLTRTMQFTLEENDLELISEYIKNGKLNELDDIVLESIKEAEGWFPEIPNFIESIRWMFTRKNIQYSIYIFAFFIVMIAIYDFRWKIIVLVILAVFFIEFLFYLEDCNNRIAVEMLIELGKRKDASKTPCDGVDLSDYTWSVWWSRNRTNCINYMRDTEKIEKQMCLARKEILNFLGELYVLFITNFIIKPLDTLWSSTEDYGFITKYTVIATRIAIFNALAYIIAGVMVPSIFQHGLREILRWWGRSNEAISSATPTNNTQEPTKVEVKIILENQTNHDKSQRKKNYATLNNTESQNHIEDATDEENKVVILESEGAAEE